MRKIDHKETFGKSHLALQTHTGSTRTIRTDHIGLVYAEIDNI